MSLCLGWKRSHADSPRRSAFGSILRATGDLPLAFSMLDEATENVLDQSESESCVANAAASCIQDVTGGPLPARLVGYAMARAMGGENRTDLSDDGCVPADMVAALSQYGICLEVDWPFDLSKVNVMPPWDVLARASAYRITAWERIVSSTLGDDLCRVIFARQPVMFGMLVGPAYQGLAIDAVYSIIDRNGGGHMQKIVGWRPSATIPGKRDFRVQNSWGRAWCAAGFSWIAEDVLLDPSCSDYYALQAAPAGIT